MTAAEPPPSPPPPERRSRWSYGKFPRVNRRTFIIIGGLVAAMVIVGVVLSITSASHGQRTTISDFAANVKFIKFEAGKQEIKVGESTTLVFNVQNSEDRVIDDAKVSVTVDPAAGNAYLSISNSTLDLPSMNMDARTGEIKVTITATGTPATEAIYIVRGTLFAEETKTDVREFQLTIKQ
jgi:hypothetical protein